MSFPFLQLQIPYGKHIWYVKLYERQCIVIITKMATTDMHRLFLLSCPLTFELDLQTFGKTFATIIFETYSSRWTFWYITTLINKEKPRDDISNCTINKRMLHDVIWCHFNTTSHEMKDDFSLVLKPNVLTKRRLRKICLRNNCCGCWQNKHHGGLQVFSFRRKRR